MIPASIPSDATPGERRVYEALAHLSDDYAAYYRRLFPGRRHVEEPDFVVLGADIGLIVVEVKDWRGPSPQAGLWDKNPLAQAKGYVHAIQDLVRKQGLPVLAQGTGAHAQELVFPCVPAVALPFVRADRWEEMAFPLDRRHVLLREDLQPGVLLERLQGLARQYFAPRLTQAQVGFLRALVAPELCLEPPSPASPPAQLDPVQAEVVTSDIFVPPPEQAVVRDLSVRLVRGVAGSGKTLILLMRARLLQRLQPAWRILVLTYNRDLSRFLGHWQRSLGGDAPGLEITHFHRWCRDLLVEAGDWHELADERTRRSLMGRAVRATEAARDFPVETAAAEIAWIREYISPPFREHYLGTKRVGRGERLTQEKRAALLDVLERYQELLRAEGRQDWEDVPLRVLHALETGRLTRARYHAVLVDETQDFAPAWFRVILPMLKPETNLLLLVGDGAQRVYRQDLCWAHLGIQVKGRSRILRRVYRNTVEIARYAAAAVQRVGSVAEDLAQYGEEWVEAELDHPWARHGADPTLRGFESPEAERAFIVEEVGALLQAGRRASEILILQARREAAVTVAEALRRHGIAAAAVKASGLTFEPPTVNVCTYHSAKGLEFPVVFCSMTALFPEGRGRAPFEGPAQIEAEAARLLYVGMTRARDLLYVTYRSG